MSVVEELLADPPQIHLGTPVGVWKAEPDCYRFLEANVGPTTRSLETGLGISTIVLAAADQHVCVVPWQREVDAWYAYMQRTGRDTSRLFFRIGPSDEVLPRLLHDDFVPPIDLFFIDGGHGFPTPILDWYYGARWLRRGGLLVIDDTKLPAVRILVKYLMRDSRWTQVANGKSWIAYRRESEGPLGEEWNMQEFML